MTLYEVIMNYAKEKENNAQKAWQRKTLEDMIEIGMVENKKSIAVMQARLAPDNTWRNMLETLGFGNEFETLYIAPAEYASMTKDQTCHLEVNTKKPKETKINFAALNKEKVAVK